MVWGHLEERISNIDPSWLVWLQKRKLLSTIIYFHRSHRGQRLSLPWRLGQGVHCFGVDQCAHPVWILALWLSASSYLSQKASLVKVPLLTTSETELMISLSVKGSGKWCPSVCAGVVACFIRTLRHNMSAVRLLRSLSVSMCVRVVYFSESYLFIFFSAHSQGQLQLQLLFSTGHGPSLLQVWSSSRRGRGGYREAEQRGLGD